jgi:prophage regulatory protein
MTDRFIRESECKAITGLSRTTRWREEQARRFPRRRKLSSGVSAWLLSEIVAWVESKVAPDNDGQDNGANRPES